MLTEHDWLSARNGLLVIGALRGFALCLVFLVFYAETSQIWHYAFALFLLASFTYSHFGKFKRQREVHAELMERYGEEYLDVLKKKLTEKSLRYLIDNSWFHLQVSKLRRNSTANSKL